MKDTFSFLLKAAALIVLLATLLYGPDVLRRHLDRACSPNDRLLNGLSFHDYEEIDAALAAGASPDAVEPFSQYTALMIAASQAEGPAVRELLRRGAAIDARDRNGVTALSHAAYWGHDQVVQELLAAGASLDDRDNDGQTTLAHAVLGGRCSTAYLLLQYGAGIDDTDDCGVTPLMLAVEYRASVPLVTLLLDACADPSRKDNDGRTAHDYALDAGNHEVAALLTGPSIVARN